MPELNGIALLEEITRLGRPMTVLLCTGFNHDVTPQQASRLGVAAIVGKPFTLAQLAHAVRAALDARRGPDADQKRPRIESRGEPDASTPAL